MSRISFDAVKLGFLLRSEEEEDREKALSAISSAFAEAHGVAEHAAQKLGVGLRTLKRWMKASPHSGNSYQRLSHGYAQPREECQATCPEPLAPIASVAGLK